MLMWLVTVSMFVELVAQNLVDQEDPQESEVSVRSYPATKNTAGMLNFSAVC